MSSGIQGTTPALFQNVTGTTSGVANTILLPASLGPASTADYIYINNTFRAGYTDGVEGNPPYSGANIGLKDRGDGYFRDLYLSNTDLYLNTSNSGFAPVKFVRDDELETILNENPVIFSNVYISRLASNGYISFVSSHEDIATGTANLGFRASNGVMQFRNSTYTNWVDIGSAIETFASNIQTITSSSNITIPDYTIGIRVRAIGAGGAGGSANTTIYSHGAGGGAGGYVELTYQTANLASKFIQVNIGQGNTGTGGNTTVHIKDTLLDPATALNQLLDAYGGSPGDTFNATTLVSNGGSGGSGQISPVLANVGYVISGQRGQPGFYSENQNLRYYHGGRGADSQFGSGGAGAYIGANASTAGYGSGGGGGIYYNDGASNTGVQLASNGGSGYAIIEFYTATLSSTGVSGEGYFYNLLDTEIDLPNIASKPYLKYGALDKIYNVALDIADDVNPALGGNLATSIYNIQFTTDNKGVLDASSNIALAFNSSNSGPAHLVIKSGYLESGEPVAEITSNITTPSIPDASIYIHPKGAGDLTLETASTALTNIITGDLVVDNTASIQLNSGYIKTSLAFYYSANLSTSSSSRTTVPANSDLIIYQITGNNGQYWTQVDAGTSGQHVNFIYETNGTNNTVNMSFINGVNPASVGVGSGLASQLIFKDAGQSVSMVYLEFGGPYDSANTLARSRWQVLNTGCGLA